MQLTHVLAGVCLALITETAQAQHCGGPCEVPRSADPVASNPKYTLSAGMESANWHYLFNWHWTEDGTQKHALADVLRAPPLGDFAYRRTFVSPSGNGFLVTGNAYSDAGRRDGRDAPLFVFCSPAGEILTHLTVQGELEARQQVTGRCHGCDCCADIMFVFAQDPRLSSDGCFVELTAYGSYGPAAIFLPFGCPVRDRDDFEGALVAAEWSRLSAPDAARTKQAIAARLAELESDDVAVRSAAAEALVAKGFLALRATQKVIADSDSANVRARATLVEARLRPLGDAAWEQIAIDLKLLRAMLPFPDPDVTRALLAQLGRIVPATAGMDAAACGAWLDEHGAKLEWSAARGIYED